MKYLSRGMFHRRRASAPAGASPPKGWRRPPEEAGAVRPAAFTIHPRECRADGEAARLDIAQVATAPVAVDLALIGESVAGAATDVRRTESRCRAAAGTGRAHGIRSWLPRLGTTVDGQQRRDTGSHRPGGDGRARRGYHGRQAGDRDRLGRDEVVGGDQPSMRWVRRRGAVGPRAPRRPPRRPA